MGRQMKGKRRSPQRREPGNATASNVRRQVLKHMNVLLAGAAVGLGSCHTDKAPPPVNCETIQVDADLFDKVKVYGRWEGNRIWGYLLTESETGDNLVFKGAPQVAGAGFEADGEECDESGCNFYLTPEEDATYIDLVLTVACDSDEHVILARMILSEAKEGEALTVEFQTYDETQAQDSGDTETQDSATGTQESDT